MPETTPSKKPEKPVECNFLRFAWAGMTWGCSMKSINPHTGRCDGKECIFHKEDMWKKLIDILDNPQDADQRIDLHTIDWVRKKMAEME